MIEMLGSLATAVGLGVGAGVNAYATFLVFGLLSRFYPGLLEGPMAEFFASTPVLIVIGVMYVIEFVADKVPMIDHAWDVLHTFIRPLAGALVAMAAATPDMPNELSIVASILGGGAALGSHLLKSGVRATSTATTAGAANPVLSVGEDIFAVVQSVLAIFLPWVVLAVLAIVLLIVLWMTRPGRRRAAGHEVPR